MAAIKVTSGDKKPEFGIAVAVTDEEAAKVALDKAIAGQVVTPTKSPRSDGLTGPAKPAKPVKAGYAFTGGYVILSDTTANATKLAEAGKAGSLARSKYAEDVEKLGSDQIGVAWADIGAAYKAIPADQLDKARLNLMGLKGVDGPKNASGRVVVGLRADPSFVEVTGKGIDILGVDSLLKGGAGTGLIASFPADVFLAVSTVGLGERVGALFTSLTANGDTLGIKSGLNKMGISSAKQFETLLGAETGLMASGTGLSMGQLEFAYRTRGSDAEAALVLARRLVDASPHSGSGVKYSKITDPDGIVVAKGPGLTGAIFDRSGSKLGGSQAFKQVVPDAGKADFAAYVDLSRFMAMVRKGNTQAWDSLKPLEALGVTATGGAEPGFRLRVSLK